MSSSDDEAVIEIQNWIESRMFLPRDLSRNFIQTFLLGCEGNRNKAKTVMENYFFARQSIPEIFMRRDPILKENVHSWKSSCFVPLRGKQNGCLIFLATSLNSENYDFTAHMKQMFMCYDLLIKNNEWGNGDRVLVLSYDRIKYKNLQSYTIYMTRKVAECAREKYLPGKLRGVHNINIPPFMNKIHEKFKPYLSKEDEKMVHFHKNLKSLHKVLNPGMLPLEFGGGAGPLKNIIDKWYEILLENRNFFIEEEENRMRETRIRLKKF